jgi:hypothetical protein
MKCWCREDEVLVQRRYSAGVEKMKCWCREDEVLVQRIKRITGNPKLLQIQ